MVEAFYWLMISAFFTHEMDAVKRHEWRVLPLTSFLPDKVGEQVFIWIHIPILFVVVWFSRENDGNDLQVLLSVFSVVHIGLHWIFRKHPDYEFNNASSWALIILAGIFGTLHIIGLTLFAA